jgi:predicted ATPase
MKVARLDIANFKRFTEQHISFVNEETEEISDRLLVLGDNGMGKTTLLQAIALPIALASGQISSLEQFDWNGFLPGRYARWGRPRIEVEVHFTEDELDATREAADAWERSRPVDARERRPFVMPGNSSVVRLVLDGDECRAQTAAELFQFRGRYYAYRLLRTDPKARSLFKRLPGLFWFDQFRNVGVPVAAPDQSNGDPQDTRSRTGFDVGVAQFRRYLNGWKLAQQSRTQPYATDYLMELENLYKRVFAGRSFAGVEPMPGVDAVAPEDYYFLLNDGHRTYDIVEMSSGEQGVFPILYRFVQQQIANSVVLIDEVDLNLHPPAAQALVAQLRPMAQTCQFILTTHSAAVSDIIGEANTRRLSGGALCL